MKRAKAPTTNTSFYIETEILQKFDFITGKKRSEFIRNAMLKEIERHERLNKLRKTSEDDYDW